LKTAIVFETGVCIEKGTNPTNPTKLTGEETAMIELLRAHPALAEKVAEVPAVVAGGSAGGETINAAEERPVGPVRAPGLHAPRGWARQAEQTAGERHRAADPGAQVRAKKKRCGTAATAGSK